MVLDARGPDELAPEDLLYEDNHLLVVRKHAGVLAQGDETGDRTVLDMVRDYIRVTCDKRGNVFLGLVHRLDRPVEGVLVLARTSKAAGRLSQQFRERTVQKTYHAVVQGRPSPESRQLDWIMAGKRCLLDFATLAQGPHSTLLEVRPHTGRKHQIRRQLAAVGHPILGDLRYGAEEPLPHRRIALLGRAIEVEHPTRGERMRFECPVPSWWPLPGGHGVQRQ